jgi:NADP-dependent 3-hydroxy acid dehydrogenase YdfG
MSTNASALNGKRALVTGASRGIGAAIARRLARDGCRVALTARSSDALRVLAGEIGGGAIAVPCDMLDTSAVQVMAEQVLREFEGAPDIVVNNAGVFKIAPLTELSVETFSDTIQTNLTAPFVLIRALLPAMRMRGTGHIVTIGSIADRMVFPENGAYSPAKYGLRALHEVLRAETRGMGVRATLVSPGSVDTVMWEEVLSTPSGDARQLPTRDVMLAADDVADAVWYAVTRPVSVNVDELRLTHG